MDGTYLDVGGVRTYCIDVGSGPPVVLFHGAAVAVDAYITWFRAIDALKDRFRVIAFDQVGFGRTDLPQDGIYMNRFERVDHALTVLDMLDVRDACLVGHSEGAFMAARIAIVEPARARSLVLVTTGGTAPYLGGDADKEWMAAADEAYNDPSRFDSEDDFMRTSLHLSRHKDERYETILRENYRRAIEVGQDDMFRSLPSGESHYVEYGELQKKYVLPHLGELNIPTLLVWSTDDGTVPVSRGLKLLEAMPSAELHVIRDAAHNVMHDQTAKFNRLLFNFCEA